MIIIAATPLGNPEDASSRLRTLLAEADLVAAEDTRRVRRLATDLGVAINGRIVSYYEAVEQSRTPELISAAAAGSTVLVVSDAGMPAVSDPGFRLVRAAAEAGIRVTALPGPSAVITALALSGLPSDRFCFEGFLPRRDGERSRTLAALAEETRTMVFFESPRRLPNTLTAMAAAFGEHREAAVCRELTKTYEEVVRGPLSTLVDKFEGDVRGEITVVVGGRTTGLSEVAPAEMLALVRKAEAAGLTRKEAIATAAGELGVSKRAVFDAVVEAKQANSAGHSDSARP